MDADYKKIDKLIADGMEEEAYNYWKKFNKFFDNPDEDIQGKKVFNSCVKAMRKNNYEPFDIKIPELGNPLAEVGEILAFRAEQYYKKDKIQEELLEVGKEQVTQLKEINEQLNAQLTSVNQTLDFILNSMGANFQRIEKQHILENQVLADLYLIISTKDGNKMKKFIAEHGIDSIGLILQVIFFFTGK